MVQRWRCPTCERWCEEEYTGCRSRKQQCLHWYVLFLKKLFPPAFRWLSCAVYDCVITTKEANSILWPTCTATHRCSEDNYPHTQTLYFFCRARRCPSENSPGVLFISCRPFPSLAYFDSFSDISCSQFRHFPLKILFPASALLSLIAVVDYYNIGWLTFYFIPKLAVSTSWRNG